MSDEMAPHLDTGISGDDNLGGRFMNWNNSGSVPSSKTSSVSVERVNMSEQFSNAGDFGSTFSLFELANNAVFGNKKDMWLDECAPFIAAHVNKVKGSNLSGDDLVAVTVWDGTAKMFIRAKENLPAEKKTPADLDLPMVDVRQILCLTHNNVGKIVPLRHNTLA